MIKITRNTLLLSAMLSFSSTVALADEIEIGMLNMTYIRDSNKITTIDIKVGDTLRFKNNDPYNHDVYSASPEAEFDLGIYPKGQSKEVTFDKPGTIEVKCSIHDGMNLTVDVK